MSDGDDREERGQTTTDRREQGDRRAEQERREGPDRRQKDIPVAHDRRSGRDRRNPAADGQRRKVERRINEYVLEPDVLEFINAVNEYKTRQQRPFPTWTEVYKVFLSLGYRKPAGE